MNYKVLLTYLLFTAFTAILMSPVKVAGARSGMGELSSVNNEAPVEEPPVDSTETSILVGYPFGKNDARYYVFINGRKLGRITPGDRMKFEVGNAATYTICNLEGSAYSAPPTQAVYSRTVTVKEGKQYYFMVENKGRLEYIFNAETGGKAYNRPGDFKTAAPVVVGGKDMADIPTL